MIEQYEVIANWQGIQRKKINDRTISPQGQRA
jgi:hypothetical protein